MIGSGSCKPISAAQREALERRVALVRARKMDHDFGSRMTNYCRSCDAGHTDCGGSPVP